MIYRFYTREIGSGIVDINGNREDAITEVIERGERYQQYADARLTGEIMVHCIEYRIDNGREIPQAALYFHQDAGYIWIGIR